MLERCETGRAACSDIHFVIVSISRHSIHPGLEPGLGKAGQVPQRISQRRHFPVDEDTICSAGGGAHQAVLPLHVTMNQLRRRPVRCKRSQQGQYIVLLPDQSNQSCLCPTLVFTDHRMQTMKLQDPWRIAQKGLPIDICSTCAQQTRVQASQSRAQQGCHGRIDVTIRNGEVGAGYGVGLPIDNQGLMLRIEQAQRRHIGRCGVGMTEALQDARLIRDGGVRFPWSGIGLVLLDVITLMVLPGHAKAAVALRVAANGNRMLDYVLHGDQPVVEQEQ